MKPLFLSIQSCCELLPNTCETFYAEISQQIKIKIQELSELAKIHGLQSAAIEYRSGFWSSARIDSADVEEEYDFNTIKESHKIRAAAFEVQSAILMVTPISFYFVASPKNCDSDITLQTSYIAVDELKNDNVYLSLQ